MLGVLVIHLPYHLIIFRVSSCARMLSLKDHSPWSSDLSVCFLLTSSFVKRYFVGTFNFRWMSLIYCLKLTAVFSNLLSLDFYIFSQYVLNHKLMFLVVFWVTVDSAFQLPSMVLTSLFGELLASPYKRLTLPLYNFEYSLNEGFSVIIPFESLLFLNTRAPYLRYGSM